MLKRRSKGLLHADLMNALKGCLTQVIGHKPTFKRSSVVSMGVVKPNQSVGSITWLGKGSYSPFFIIIFYMRIRKKEGKNT